MQSQEGPGSRLRRAREIAGKSLSEAAAVVGRSRQAVHKWEQDPAEVKAGHLAALCEFYGVTLDAIFGDATAAGLSREARRLGAEFDALPRDLQRQWLLLWEVFGRQGVVDPVGPR